MKRILAAASTVALLAFAGVASADTAPTLSGGATLADNVITLVSNTGDTTTTNDASSATFTVPSGTTFAQLTTLSAEFNTTDDGCAAGSPRITVHLASGNNVFVYLGQAGNVNSCALNSWISTGNLIGNNDMGRYDTSQVQPGTQVTTYSAALALVGSKVVTSVSFDVDAGYAFADKEQTSQLRAFAVNNQTFPEATTPAPTPKPNPARLCKAQQQANPAAFKALYGTNHNKANAFGKCVSAMARSVSAGTVATVQKQRVAAFKVAKAHKAKKHG
jgi:hypothetical protein